MNQAISSMINEEQSSVKVVPSPKNLQAIRKPLHRLQEKRSRNDSIFGRKDSQKSRNSLLSNKSRSSYAGGSNTKVPQKRDGILRNMFISPYKEYTPGNRIGPRISAELENDENTEQIDSVFNDTNLNTEGTSNAVEDKKSSLTTFYFDKEMKEIVEKSIEEDCEQKYEKNASLEDKTVTCTDDKSGDTTTVGKPEKDWTSTNKLEKSRVSTGKSDNNENDSRSHSLVQERSTTEDRITPQLKNAASKSTSRTPSRINKVPLRTTNTSVKKKKSLVLHKRRVSRKNIKAKGSSTKRGSEKEFTQTTRSNDLIVLRGILSDQFKKDWEARTGNLMRCTGLSCASSVTGGKQKQSIGMSEHMKTLRLMDIASSSGVNEDLVEKEGTI